MDFRTHVFTYGTLMVPAIWSRVVRGTYATVPGILHGFSRRCLRGRSYPGLIKGNGSVTGVLYLEVRSDDLLRLDRFEGDEYTRVSGQIECPRQEPFPAAFYVVSSRASHLVEDEEWIPEVFTSSGANRFFMQK
ncbi:MAG: gamma-glutamylcyclotransferase family protein [Desulfovibrionales bacterium]